MKTKTSNKLKVLSLVLSFVLLLGLIPTTVFAATAYPMQKSASKCSVIYSFSINNGEPSSSCRAGAGDSITGTATITPNTGYEFNRIAFSDSWNNVGNITIPDFMYSIQSENVVSFSFTMPEKPVTGDGYLIFNIICELPVPPTPVPSISITSTSDTLEYDTNNVRYVAQVTNTNDQSVIKSGTVQFYLNGAVVGSPASYSTEHRGYSIAIRSWNNNDNIPYFNMGENEVYAIYTYTDNTTSVTSDKMAFTLTKKDVDSSLSSSNSTLAVYDGTDGKNRAGFSLSPTNTPTGITLRDFDITATRNGAIFNPTYEYDYNDSQIRFFVPDSGEYTFTATLKDSVEKYKASESASVNVAKREITLKPVDATNIILNSEIQPSFEITSGSIAENDEITNVQYKYDTSVLGISEIEILSYQLTNSDNYQVTVLNGKLDVFDFADYSKVDEAIAKANALVVENYKDFSAVTGAINAVARDKNITEQSEVDLMAKAINDSISALELKGADYSKVDEAIAKANALVVENYKDFSAVTNAINAVVRDKNITEQSEVDLMAKAIDEAINALELKPTAPPTNAPEIVEGANQSVVQGNTAVFKSNADLKHFQKVLVDSKEVPSSNYTLKEGSTIVMLNADFIKTLGAGKHTLSIVSTTGTADTEFTITQPTTIVTPDAGTPKMGDDGYVSLWVVFFLASASGAVWLHIKRKKILTL